MLSAFVNDHHSDWDRYLSYVMMAYRASVHETTGFTPNYMMLGREVSTALDIMYDMPNAVKYIPNNQWVWHLKETMEDAHRHVRENIKAVMMRQKRDHDQKMSWQQFKKGDEVYVFFPVRRAGLSPKFTSYWRGPYVVIDRMTDNTYKVNCGPRGKPQIVHVDRLRLKRSQTLRDEVVEDSTSQEGISQDTEKSVTDNERNDIEAPPSEDNFDVDGGGARFRRPPTWLQDYVLD
ncbi:uncharacterized protein LOC133185046 [Saccostrea echinata]|uniref:uncharacterized protein LOC133185046 n=1 Tax=Saccostrea echinata TaxID=191078 RepID=UPI002A837B69|nr:uncharacterized protein LOC133185046 [Saccostrea echinata]